MITDLKILTLDESVCFVLSVVEHCIMPTDIDNLAVINC